MKNRYWIPAFCLFLCILPNLCLAQEAGEPEKHYSGNLGAGLSLTRGNTSTTNFNFSGEMTYDPKTKNVMKFEGLYLKTRTGEEDTADRLSLGFRDEYSLSKRVFVYGALGYVRDPFKDIRYLLNPQGGVGFKPILNQRIELSLNGGGGAVWEKNTDTDVRSSGTLNAGENFSVKLSDSARLTQGFSALWKTEDFSDAFYHFNVALVTSITSRSEVKIEFIDDFKNVTPSPDIKKNDSAFIVSFLYKI